MSQDPQAPMHIIPSSLKNLQLVQNEYIEIDEYAEQVTLLKYKRQDLCALALLLITNKYGLRCKLTYKI